VSHPQMKTAIPVRRSDVSGRSSRTADAEFGVRPDVMVDLQPLAKNAAERAGTNHQRPKK
jgi:hypothetical protein